MITNRKEKQKAYGLSILISFLILGLLFVIKISPPKKKDPVFIPIQIDFALAIPQAKAGESTNEMENKAVPLEKQKGTSEDKPIKSIENQPIKKKKVFKENKKGPKQTDSKKAALQSHQKKQIPKGEVKTQTAKKINQKEDKAIENAQKKQKTEEQNQAQQSIANLLQAKDKSAQAARATQQKQPKALVSGTSSATQNYELSGRSALTKPKPDYPCNETGKIVVEIWVDPKGQVIEASIGRGTTNNATCLTQPALAAAKKTTFTPLESAPQRQKGEIFYHFKLVK